MTDGKINYFNLAIMSSKLHIKGENHIRWFKESIFLLHKSLVYSRLCSQNFKMKFEVLPMQSIEKRALLSSLLERTAGRIKR